MMQHMNTLSTDTTIDGIHWTFGTGRRILKLLLAVAEAHTTGVLQMWLQ